MPLLTPKQLEQAQQAALEEFKTASTTQALYDARIKYLGKKGLLTLSLRALKELPSHERAARGASLNSSRQVLEQAYKEHQKKLQHQQLSQSIQSQAVDMSLPGGRAELAARRHIIDEVINEITHIMHQLGFCVQLGPLIESHFNNFEALNIPPNHPALDMHDTFYIDSQHVLRTHTSPVQVRVLKSMPPPMRILAPGEVFRCDNDSSHLPAFYQIEGLLVEREVSLAHLKGCMEFFVKKFFGPKLKTRFRPSYFPFTEPSAEVDCQCPACQGKGCGLCKQTGWIEIGGSGLVHPRVFKLAGLPPVWQGFAFGLGVERMAMVKHGIDNIKLFNENHLDFLKQTPS